MDLPQSAEIEPSRDPIPTFSPRLRLSLRVTLSMRLPDHQSCASMRKLRRARVSRAANAAKNLGTSSVGTSCAP